VVQSLNVCQLQIDVREGDSGEQLLEALSGPLGPQRAVYELTAVIAHIRDQDEPPGDSATADGHLLAHIKARHPARRNSPCTPACRLMRCTVGTSCSLAELDCVVGVQVSPAYLDADRGVAQSPAPPSPGQSPWPRRGGSAVANLRSTLDSAANTTAGAPTAATANTADQDSSADQAAGRADVETAGRDDEEPRQPSPLAEGDEGIDIALSCSMFDSKPALPHVNWRWHRIKASAALQPWDCLWLIQTLHPARHQRAGLPGNASAAHSTALVTRCCGGRSVCLHAAHHQQQQPAAGAAAGAVDAVQRLCHPGDAAGRGAGDIRRPEDALHALLHSGAAPVSVTSHISLQQLHQKAWYPRTPRMLALLH
jgi:hypothetical protein